MFDNLYTKQQARIVKTFANVEGATSYKMYV